MKRILSAVTSMLLTLSLTACGSAGGSDVPPAEPDTEPPVEESGEQNVLVAYFSWSGNTEEMAAYIAEQIGGDLLEIQPRPTPQITMPAGKWHWQSGTATPGRP